MGFDWSTATGCCISHFDERWGLCVSNGLEERIGLLKKGLRSSFIAKGIIRYLDVSSLSAVFTLLREFCQLHIPFFMGC